MTLQHVVLFKFPEDTGQELLDELRDRVMAWPNVLPGIEVLRLGADLTGERTRGHQLLLYMEFDSQETLVAYQTHPHHQAFLHWVLDHHCEPLAFDYVLDESTVFVGRDG
jgi:hypothetical protein